MLRVSAPLDPSWLGMLRPLERAGVEHVALGALAATVHGRPQLGGVLVLAPAGYRRNLERLAAALAELETGIRIEGEHQTLPIERDWLLQAPPGRLCLGTDEGSLDLMMGHYAALIDRSRPHELVRGLVVEVAAPEDVLGA